MEVNNNILESSTNYLNREAKRLNEEVKAIQLKLYALSLERDSLSKKLKELEQDKENIIYEIKNNSKPDIYKSKKWLEENYQDGDEYTVEGSLRLFGLPSNENDFFKVKKAYRKLVVQWHPDRILSPNLVEEKYAEKIIIKLNMAFQTLKGSQMR